MTIEQGRVGSYKLLEEVGNGGLGRVFRAIDLKSGRTVAVKFLHDKFSNNRKFLGIFHRELLIISRLHHKHIVSYLDSGFEPPECYIVTEFIEGWSLHVFLKKIGKTPPLVALCIVIDMLQGIDYLHLHDTIHADLSSANVLIEKTGRVMVTDFGLACERDVEDYKNYMVGTPGYYSPEHITETSIVPQTDIYCAGLLLYELLTGHRAVPASNDRKKILHSMREIDFGRIHCSERSMENSLKKLLSESLQLSVKSRIHGADAMMFECYRILKKYGIRYARHAVKQFLIDSKMTRGPFDGKDQQIYLGAKKS